MIRKELATTLVINMEIANNLINLLFGYAQCRKLATRASNTVVITVQSPTRDVIIDLFVLKIFPSNEVASVFAIVSYTKIFMDITKRTTA